MKRHESAVSFMTIAELNRWAIERSWGNARRERLTRLLEQFVVVFADLDLCEIWASVTVEARRSGMPIQTADAWIAATAVYLNVPLLTNDHNDFAGIASLTVLR
jgi:predicted nucleic acid-binding protein